MWQTPEQWFSLRVSRRASEGSQALQGVQFVQCSVDLDGSNMKIWLLTLYKHRLCFSVCLPYFPVKKLTHHPNNLKRKSRKQFHLQSHKRERYLGTNLTKEAKVLHTENDKTLLKENPSRWKDLSCNWIRRLHIVKMPVLQSDLQTQCNPYQNSSGVFYRNRNIHPKIHRESQGTLNSKNNLEK